MRAALQIIGKAADARLVSSFFLMSGSSEYPVLPGVIFADCGLVVAPGPRAFAGMLRARIAASA